MLNKLRRTILVIILTICFVLMYKTMESSELKRNDSKAERIAEAPERNGREKERICGEVEQKNDGSDRIGEAVETKSGEPEPTAGGTEQKCNEPEEIGGEVEKIDSEPERIDGEVEWKDTESDRIVGEVNGTAPENNKEFDQVKFSPGATVPPPVYKHRPKLLWNCTIKRFAPEPIPVTALASMPGSGNTWARNLIELITGIYTGAIYNDNNLHAVFPGEGWKNGSVAAVKTHCAKEEVDMAMCRCFKTGNSTVCADRVILVVRHPADAYIAEWTRRSTSDHTGTVETTLNVTGKDVMISKFLQRWVTFHKFWMELVELSYMDIFILYYEDMMNNLPRATERLAEFFGAELNSEHEKCVVENAEGSFHRPHNSTVPNALHNSTILREGLEQVKNMTMKCVANRRCATSGSLWGVSQ